MELDRVHALLAALRGGAALDGQDLDPLCWVPTRDIMSCEDGEFFRTRDCGSLHPRQKC
jgi:hypothetical protein